jgi:hypothetical protein
MKLEAEAFVFGDHTITFKNMIDHLHYAYSMNCALLKKASLDFIIGNLFKFLKRVRLKNAPGGLLADVLIAVVEKGDSVLF